MNDPVYELEWDSDAAALQEAMVLAGQHLFQGKRGLWTLLNIVLMLLTALGGAGMAFLVALYGWGSRDPGFLVLLVGSGVGVGLFTLYQRWPIAVYARQSAASSYGSSRQCARADTAGITFTNAATEWQSGWRAVRSLKTGKKGISVGVSGIAFSIPLAAFGSAAEMQAVGKQLQVRKEGATQRGQQDGT